MNVLDEIVNLQLLKEARHTKRSSASPLPKIELFFQLMISRSLSDMVSKIQPPSLPRGDFIAKFTLS